MGCNWAFKSSSYFLPVPRHSGVISRFDREFVKTGHFDKIFSKWLHDAFDLRQRADYREMFEIDASRTSEVIEHAREFVAEIRRKVDSY